jgi:hypothetical protein
MENARSRLALTHPSLTLELPSGEGVPEPS